LIKFKFCQICLNSHYEFTVYSAELSANSADFCVLKNFCSFRSSNAFQPNFSELPPNFLLLPNFQTLCGSRRWMKALCVVPLHNGGPCRLLLLFYTIIWRKKSLWDRNCLRFFCYYRNFKHCVAVVGGRRQCAWSLSTAVALTVCCCSSTRSFGGRS
jgi:hypothetical protein